MDAPTTFGDWLQQRRKALGLTREQLAARVGCSVSALRKLESGERRPSLQVAGLLANALNLPDELRPAFLRVARGEPGLERLPPPDPFAAQERAAGRPKTAAQPALRSLPTTATPLVGRRTELAGLTRLLQAPDCRLVTLVGPGGVGKTRLAIDAARQAGEAWPDGTVFVALAPLSSARFIVPAIANALGLTFSGPADPQAQLVATLRDRRMLLLLDNAEHLLAGGIAELAAELLEAAPGLMLLVTSREVLNLQAEWVFPVHGLLVPAGPDAAEPAEGSAVELFLQRAQRAHVGFVPRAEDHEAILRICRLVEGLPLALELAAAWVRILSCTEIAAELERDPGGLAVSGRDLPARHRSLQAVFDHSWQLLDHAEQQALMRLAVFRGGFTRAAAEAVAGASLALLSALLTKSLVRRAANGRYDLHELVLQYARGRLREAGAEEQTRRAHAEWFLAFARRASVHSYTPTAPAWLDEVEQEHHNIREVLRWALEPAAEPGSAAAAERVAGGLGVLCALADFLFVRGHHHEALGYFEKLLARPEASASPALRMQALNEASYFYYLQGRLAEAQAALTEALALGQALGDREQLARTLEYRGLAASAAGDRTAARADLEQSLALWREVRVGFRESGVLSHLGDIALSEHDYERAEQLYTAALQAGVEPPAQSRHPYPPRRLAYLVLRRGDCARAEELIHQSLRLNLAIHDSRAVAACLVALAGVARVQGDFAQAARRCGAAEGILHAIGASLLPADREEYDGTVAALQSALSEGDLAAAWAGGRALSLAGAVAEVLPAG